MKTLDQHVLEMKNLSKRLIPYSFPFKSSFDEIDLLPLKTRIIDVGNYEISIYFNVQKFELFQLNSLSLFSLTGYYLPFSLCLNTIATKFLGEKGIIFDHVIINNKRVYKFNTFAGYDNLKQYKENEYGGIKFYHKNSLENIFEG